MGTMEVTYNGNTYTISEKDLQKFQKEIKKAKSESDKQAIFDKYFQNSNIVQSNNGSADADIGDVVAAQQAVQQAIARDPNKLPDVYQRRYEAATNEAEKRAVIEDYFADERYFPSSEYSGKTLFGNRSSKIDDVRNPGIGMSKVLEKDALIDEDGKPIKENQKSLYNDVQTEYQRQFDEALENVNIDDQPDLAAKLQAQIDAINNDSTLTAAQKQTKIEQANARVKKEAQDSLILNEALNNACASQVEELAEKIKNNGTTANKSAYYDLVLTNEERSEVNKKTAEYQREINELIQKPTAELTQLEKAQLEKYKKLFNTKFPDEKFLENEHLWDLKECDNQETVKAANTKINALCQMLAIEDKIGAVELTDDQRTELAKAQLKETITSEKAIEKLSAQLQEAENNGDTDTAEKLKKDIAKRVESKDAFIKDLKKSMVSEAAYNQTLFETYKQKYERTHVSWDKSQAKAMDKNPETAVLNNTYLNKYAQELIKSNADFRTAVCVEATKNDYDFEADGKFYKLDSDKYKAEMLRLSNKQTAFNDTALDADYYASADEWSEFANEHTGKKSGIATLGERKDVREMLEAAGIEVEKDASKKARWKKTGQSALIGAGAGLVSGLMGEALACAQNINYSGTASGVVSTMVSGYVTGTVTGTVSDTITGTASGTVDTTFTSTTKVYDPLTGEYVTTGTQTTTVPVDVTLPYETNVELGYSQDVTLEYNTQTDVDATLDYTGKTHKDFSFENVGKSMVIGAAGGALWTGLKQLFGKQKNRIYVNQSSNLSRQDTGYSTSESGKPKEATVTVTKTIEEVQTTQTTSTTTTSETMETETFRLKRRKKADGTYEAQLPWAMICDKYGVKYNSDEYKKILAYVRKLNGVGPGQMPKGDEWVLPKEIPAEVCGRVIKITNNEVRYQPISGNGNLSTGSGADIPTTTTTVTTTVTTTTTTVTTTTTEESWTKSGNNDAERTS